VKILIVHDVAGKAGGAETNVLQVATALRERGMAPALLYGRDTGVRTEEFLAPFETSFQWEPEGDDRSDSWQRALALAKDWNPDVAYVHKLGHLDLLDALTHTQIPLVRMMHDHDIYCQRSSRYFPWNRKICTKKAGYHCALTCGILRDREGPLPIKLAWPGKKLREVELSKRFDLNITVADYMSEQLVKHGFDPKRIVVHPPAPAIAEIEKTDYSERLVLFVGQLLRGKGVDLMLQSLKKIENEDWTAVIAGSGSHFDACVELNKKLGLTDRVTFTGRLEKAELNDLYRRARLAVVPSVWPEPMPLVGYEFMAHALPSVGFDAGGIPYWLKDGHNGILCPVHDTDAMAAGISKLLDDPELAERMGRIGYEHVAANHLFPQYITRLTELLAGAAGIKARTVSSSAPVPVPAGV
jgi:glycosyltransferase involved in cell wall biosynthesis